MRSVSSLLLDELNRRYAASVYSVWLDFHQEETTMAVYCSRCGTGLPETARFCSNCGVAVVGVIPRKPLVRPRAGRQIAGVCIGLAQTYGWDLALVRIFAAGCLLFTGGLILLVYLACWVGIPEEPLLLPPGEYPTSV
jgi:phage shock protein C